MGELFGHVVQPNLGVRSGDISTGGRTSFAENAKPAPVSVLSKLVDIPHQQFTLPNGLRVIVHTDRKAPIVAVSVWYGIGSKNEPKGKTGFAHLFEHLMFNGSEHSPGDYFEPLQQVGATDYNGTTSFDRTNYFETVPTGALERALFLESDRMGHLLGAVTQEKLDNQRGVVQNEKRQGDNQSYGLVDYFTYETLFPEGHPYHHETIGSMADLSGASLADVHQWFRDNYGPNNAVLALAGDIDLATAKTLVEKYFGDIKRGPAVRSVVAPVPALSAPKSEVMKDRVATTRIFRMWAIPGLNDKDAAALQGAADVLGGLSSSRLSTALVRTEKIAVATRTGVTAYQQVGIFTVSVDVKPGVDAAKVSSRLDALIADFLRSGPTADELNRAATTRIAAAIRSYESIGGFGGKATALARGLLFSDNADFYKVELAALAALKPATVKAVANKWLSRPVYSLTVEPGERTESGAERGGDPGLKPAPSPAAVADTGPAPSQGVDRSKLPELEALGALNFPAIERAKLSNGMEVIFARRASVPFMLAAVSFDVGYAADPKSALGTQSLMLRLLIEGTTTRNSVAIAEERERLGAGIGIGASLDRTYVTIGAPSPNLAPAFDLIADIARNPAFDPAEVERLRGQQLARISSEFNNPDSIAQRTLWPVLFGDAHPYGLPPSGTGDPAVVAKLTRDDLVRFHAQWLRPDNGQIFVVGDTTLAELVPVLEHSFGGWKAPAGAKPPAKAFDVASPAPKPRIILIDRPKSPQSVIYGGELLDAKGRDNLVPLETANEVLGGSFLSRLNMNLRETKGWSYGVSSDISGYLEAAPFLIAAPVQADRTGDSIKELLAEMKSFLTDKGVTAAELERTVNGDVRGLPGSFETMAAVLSGIQGIVNYNRPDDYYARLPAEYTSLTAAQLDAVARAKLDPKKLVFVVVGDATVVRPQLDQLNLPVELVPAPALH